MQDGGVDKSDGEVGRRGAPMGEVWKFGKRKVRRGVGRGERGVKEGEWRGRHAWPWNDVSRGGGQNLLERGEP